jgi:hypothetical protein
VAQIPLSGPFTLLDVVAEFGGALPRLMSDYLRTPGGLITAGNTGVPTTLPLLASQFRGAVKSTPGSASYTSPGTYQLVVPPNANMTFDVRGAGGGGGGSAYDGNGFGSAGTGGGASSVDVGVVGYGGNGGQGWSVGVNGGQAAHGGGGGGDTNITGGGAAGGAGGVYGFTAGQAGGNGGRAIRTIVGIAAGTILTIAVGAGGNRGAGQQPGQFGSPGAVYISWT